MNLNKNENGRMRREEEETGRDGTGEAPGKLTCLCACYVSRLFPLTLISKVWQVTCLIF